MKRDPVVILGDHVVLLACLITFVLLITGVLQ